MICYVDTSALVCAYVHEAASQAVRARLEAAEVLATSVLTWAESLATFARLGREGRCTPSAAQSLETNFRADWPGLVRLRHDARLLPEIARLLRFHPLRGADVVHLASALLLHRRLAEPVGQVAVFLATDAALNRAAAMEGLEVLSLVVSERKING